MADAQRNVRLFVILVGDWMSVITLFRENEHPRYYQALLGQGPHDEDDSQYSTYRLEVDSQRELLEVLTLAREKRMQAHVAVHIQEAGVDVWCETNNAWGSDGPYALVKSAIHTPSDSVVQRDYQRLMDEYSEHQAVATSRIAALEKELAEVSEALRQARNWARTSQQTTMRQFAKACGITPVQLSRWTMVGWDEPPDIVCRRGEE